MPSSFTLNFKDDVVLDSAVLYCDLVTPGTMVKWGGTRGGLTFNRNIEIRSIPYDGARGETAGLHRKTDGVPTISGTALLFGPRNLAALEPGSTTEIVGGGPGAVMTVTPLPYTTMLDAATDYHEWHCLWKRGNGGTFKVIFPVGYATIDSIGAQDNNEGEAPLTIKAVNNPDDIDGNDEVPAPYRYEVTGPDIDDTYYGTGSY